MTKMMSKVEAKELIGREEIWPRDPLTLAAGTQQVLEELWSEGRIPFALRVGKITKALGEYTIHFYDSRIYSADVPVKEDHSFTEIVRSAVLNRVEEIRSPFSASRTA